MYFSYSPEQFSIFKDQKSNDFKEGIPRIIIVDLAEALSEKVKCEINSEVNIY